MDKIQMKMETSRKLADKFLKLITGYKASEAYVGICMTLAALVKTGDVPIESIKSMSKNIEGLLENITLEQTPKK